MRALLLNHDSVRRRRGLVGAALIVAVALSTAVAGDGGASAKLIEWGWDEPDTSFLRAHIEKMERLPFDGIVFHPSGPNLVWEVWGTRRFAVAEFQKAIDDLNATKFRRFTDRFLRVNVTPGNVDWFDDAGWRTVAQNFGVAAQLAKRGKCKGFMFDTEQWLERPRFLEELFHAGGL